METQQFGCKACFGDDAAAAWKAKQKLTSVAQLVDESHFSVSIVACPACSQRFVSLFCERINWSGGDDSQYFTLLPITPEESATVISRGLEVELLESWGNGRRQLQVDLLDQAKGVYWAQRFVLAPHD